MLARLRAAGSVHDLRRRAEGAPRRDARRRWPGRATHIFQAYLADGRGLAGYADFLARRPEPCPSWGHHWEVWDSKLARSVTPDHLVQLCAYADLLGAMQGLRPARVGVVLGADAGAAVRHDADRSFFYYREVRRRAEARSAAWDAAAPPDPADDAEHGRWSGYAAAVLAAADHPLRVANVTRRQARRLADAGVATLAALAGPSAPAPTPGGGWRSCSTRTGSTSP